MITSIEKTEIKKKGLPEKTTLLYIIWYFGTS